MRLRHAERHETPRAPGKVVLPVYRHAQRERLWNLYALWRIRCVSRVCHRKSADRRRGVGPGPHEAAFQELAADALPVHGVVIRGTACCHIEGGVRSHSPIATFGQGNNSILSLDRHVRDTHCLCDRHLKTSGRGFEQIRTQSDRNPGACMQSPDATMKDMKSMKGRGQGVPAYVSFIDRFDGSPYFCLHALHALHGVIVWCASQLVAT